MNETVRGLWIGGELSLMEQLSIQSFINNGHSFELYIYEAVKNIPDGTIIKDANAIIPQREIYRLKKGINKDSLTSFSNLFRFKLLLEKGGWWVDLDIVCLKPFEFDSPWVLTSEYDEPDGFMGPSNGVLKVPKGDRFIEECYKMARSLSIENLNFGDTGFKLVRYMVKKYGLGSYVKPPEIFAPLNWWEFKSFIDPRYSIPDLSGAHAIHLYNEMWRIEGLDKNVLYSENTLYGMLLRKTLNRY